MPVFAANRPSRLAWLASLIALVLSMSTAPAWGGALSQERSDNAGQLLTRLQSAVANGSAEDFLALGKMDRNAPDVRAFLDRWFLQATTAAELRERDRQALPGDRGVRLVVEALVEAGPQARLATWRIDVIEDASGWQITSATTVSGVDGLFRLALNPSRQFKAHNLVVKSEDLELRLPDGYVFIAEAAGRTTAAVLVGRGEMVFRPSPDTERRQIRLFGGQDELKTPFSSAFIRLSPSDALSTLSSTALTPATAEGRLFERARSFFAEQVPKSFGLDLADLSRESWSLVPTIGDFLAEVETRRFGTLTYTQSGNDPEDITVFDRARRRNISVYASKGRLAAQGRSFDEDDSAEIDVQDLQIDTTFSPERFWIDGQTRVRLKIRSYALTALTLRLAEALVVRSVTSEKYGRLLALRVRGQNSIVVNLPEAAKRDEELTLTVTYAGRLLPQGVDRENIAIQGQEFSSTILSDPEPSHIYSNRSYWYAQAPATDYATATIRFTVPPIYTTACSGEQAAGSPVLLKPSRAEGDTRKLHVFTAIAPVRYLACVTSRFTAMEPSVTPPAAQPSDGGNQSLPLHLLSTARQRGRARDALSRAGEILAFYTSIMKGAPYPSLTLAVVESNIPGGHAPAYLAILNQPLPTTPFVWRDDPAAFDDFPDFFIAHELAHQWWGQAVGWKNYHEQWLSEGLAQYFAVLYAEHDRGPQVFGGLLRQLARWSLDMSDQGPIFLGYRLGHVKGEGRIFRALVYNKGAAVLHMLRRMLGDEVFFRSLRRFYSEHRFAKAGTNDLQLAFETEAGRSLANFFERWVMGQDVPTVTASHNVSADGTSVDVHLHQPAAHVFEFPVTVSIAYADGTSEDVTVTVSEAVTTRTFPLKKRLRTVDVNRDKVTPVRVSRK